ncbi:MAG TPA: Ig-like domain-containing protein [Gemmataceae bacterium]|nr:Ig-like domain-containing protein [Gemmataceae bacterium]
MTRARSRIARPLRLDPLEDRCVPAGGVWAQRGGDPGHTNYVDIRVNAGGISPAWSQSIDFTSETYWDQYGNRAVAVDESHVYRTELDQVPGTAEYHVMAYDLETGTQVWDRVIEEGGVSAPSVGNGYVYINRAGSSGGSLENYPYLAALDPQTGATVLSRTYAAQLAFPSRPLLDGDQVINDDGYYSGFGAWDATTFADQWHRPDLSFAAEGTLSERYLYLYPRLVLSRADGETVRTVAAPARYPTLADPIVSPSGRVFYEAWDAANRAALVAYSDGGGSRLWTRPLPDFAIGKAVGNGVVAVVSRDTLLLLKETTGAVLRTWTAPAGAYLEPRVVLTRTHAFVEMVGYASAPSTVYAVNLATGQAEWSFTNALTAEFGSTAMEMAIGGGKLILSHDGFVKAFGLPEPVATPPAAADDAAATAEDTPVVVAVLDNDISFNAGPLTGAAVGAPTHGTAQLSADGTITYTPAPDYHGTDSFTYTARDTLGLTDTATVSVTITPVNDAPVLADARFVVTFPAAGVAAGTVTAAEVDGDPVAYAITAGDPLGKFAIDPGGTIRLVDVTALDYAYDLTVTATDPGLLSDAATVRVVVGNTGPVGQPYAPPAADEDTVIAVDLGGAFADAEQTDAELTYELLTAPLPALFVSAAISGNTLTLVPAAETNGSADLTVRATDPHGLSAEAVVRVTVRPVNDAPVIDTTYLRLLPPIPMPIPPNTFLTGLPVAALADHATDVDGDVLGVAVTAADATGTWQRSTAGGWADFPPVSEADPLFLFDDGQTQVRFIPNTWAPGVRPFRRGFASIGYRAWDGSADLSPQLERAWVAVGKTAPVVDPDGHPLLRPVKEDVKASRAFKVKAFLGLLAREQDPGRSFGIALSGTTGVGAWEFNTGRGGWRAVESVSETAALLLRPTDRLRFRPAADYDGDARLTYHTWVPNLLEFGTKVNLAAATGVGLATETAILDVRAVNDRPVVTGAPDLGAVAAGGATAAVTVADFLAGLATDVDSTGLGVQLLRADRRVGAWQYKDGAGTWVDVTGAKTLTAATEIRFRAAATAAAGPYTVSFKAWDGTPKSATAFSSAAEATLTITL